MVRNKCDWNLYDSEADFPDYGNWVRQSVGKDNLWTFVGDSNPSKLPHFNKGIPMGSTAIGTDKSTYVLNASDEWTALVTS